VCSLPIDPHRRWLDYHQPIAFKEVATMIIRIPNEKGKTVFQLKKPMRISIIVLYFIYTTTTEN
jgi:hypothetical protein